MRLTLFQPDIPQNTGAILRLAACFGVGVDVIEPCGFIWDEPRMRRAGMDYIDAVDIRRHVSWAAYRAAPSAGRLVLLTTRGARSYVDFAFRAEDSLLFGRESAGVPAAVHDAADARLVVPIRAGMRSLNVAMTAAIVLAEALRQTGLMPQTMPERSGESA
jgi:tRNA (cytidine/uridine-2'-O-)-methyltransferase